MKTTYQNGVFTAKINERITFSYDANTGIEKVSNGIKIEEIRQWQPNEMPASYFFAKIEHLEAMYSENLDVFSVLSEITKP